MRGVKCKIEDCSNDTIALGLCEKHYCQYKGARKQKRRKENKQCLDCGTPLENTHLLSCDACRKKKQEKRDILRRTRKAKNLCCVCGSPAITKRLMVNNKEKKWYLCGYCYMKRTAHNSLGSYKKCMLLEELWKEQEGKCYYTGLPLTMGINSSVDHIVPTSKNGSNEKKNLCWTLYAINRMKLDKDKAYFIKLCKEVNNFVRGKNEKD